MKKVIVFLVLGLCGLLLIGCSIRKVPEYDKTKEYSFNATQDSIFQNPPAGKTRLYTYRITKGNGFNTMRYTLSAFKPKDFVRDNVDYKKATFISKMAGQEAAYADIDSGEVILYAKTEAPYEFAFEAKPDKIYCVEVGVKAGVWTERPVFAVVSQDICEPFIKQYFNDKSQEIREKHKAAFEAKYPRQK